MVHIKGKKSTGKRDQKLDAQQSEFIAKLTTCTNEELLKLLREETTWRWSQTDNIYNWEGVLNRFDTILSELPATCEPQTITKIPVLTSAFPRDLVLHILLFSQLIVQNTHNRHQYASLDRLTWLLTVDDTEIVMAVLVLLSVYVSRSQFILQQHAHLGSQLFQLAKGWGGKQDGLGLLHCAQASDVSAQTASGTTLHFEFYVSKEEAAEQSKAAQNSESAEAAKPTTNTTTTPESQPATTDAPTQEIDPPPLGQTIIHIPNLHTFTESNTDILKMLVHKFRIPHKYHFPLLVRIRLARSFLPLEIRRDIVRTNLLAFTVLADQSQNDPGMYLASFFMYEPEFLSELMEFVRSDVSLPANFRILALKALTALLTDNNRLPAVISATGCAQHHGDIPSMVRKSVATLTASVEHPIYTPAFIDALLSFIAALISTQEGVAALNTAGLLSSLLPVVSNSDPGNLDAVLKCLQILAYFMASGGGGPALSQFRDLGGLDSLLNRFIREVEAIKKQQESGGQQPLTESDGKGKERAEPTTERGPIESGTKTLLKTLMRVAAPFIQGTRRRSATRLTTIIDGPLPATLTYILRNYDLFGEAIFAHAIVFMAGLINNDPTRFNVLFEAGLPTQFLEIVSHDLKPSSQVIAALPAALSSVCLNTDGLASVIEKKAIANIFSMFTNPQFQEVLRGDPAQGLGSGMDELFRHHNSLRPVGVAAAIKEIETICTLGGVPVDSVQTNEKPVTPVEKPAETQEASKEAEQMEVEQTSAVSESDTPSTESKPIESVKFNVMEHYVVNICTFLETLFANADNANAFIKAKGVSLLLHIYALPGLPSFIANSSSAAQGMAVVFRALAMHQSSTIFGELLKNLQEQFAKLNDTCSWQKGQGFVRDKDDPVVLNVLSGIESLTNLLSVLVRDPATMNGNGAVTTLTQWTTETGLAVCRSLGELQRCILWELASESFEKRKRRIAEASNKAIELIPATDATPAINTETTAGAAEMEVENEQSVKKDGSGSAELQIPESAQPAEKQRRKTRRKISLIVSAIHTLSQSLARALSEGHRRRDEKHIMSVVDVVCNTLTSHVTWRPAGFEETDSAIKSAYLASVVGELRSLFFNERSTNSLLLYVFNHIGGVESLLKEFSQLVDIYARLRMEEVKAKDLEVNDKSKGKEKDTGVTPMTVAEEEEEEQATSGDKKVTKQKSPRDPTLLTTEATLLTFGSFLRYLVNGPTLFSSSVTANMLTAQSLPGLKGAFDPYSFLAGVQCKVLMAVLPVWNHELFSYFPPSFVTALLHVNNSILEGETHLKPEKKKEPEKKQPTLDPGSVSMLMEMGFSKAHCEEALRTVGNNLEVAAEWLFSNPPPAVETPAEAPMSEEDELAQAMAMSLGQSDQEAASVPVEEKEVNYAEKYNILRQGMLDKCLSLLAENEDMCSTVAEMLSAMCKKSEERTAVVNTLLGHVKTVVHTSQSKALYTYAHLLMLLIIEDAASRQVVAEAGIVPLFLDLLANPFVEQKEKEEPKPTEEATTKPEEAPQKKLAQWVSPVLLVLDVLCMLPAAVVVKKEKRKKVEETGDTASQPEVKAEEQAASDKETPTKDTKAIKQSKESLRESQKESPKESDDEETVYELEIPIYLSPQERKLAIERCASLLEATLPKPTLHAVLQLLARLTRDYELALQFLKQGGLAALLKLQGAPINLLSSILRHLLEEPSLLQSVMESEIKTIMHKPASRGEAIRPKNYLLSCSSLITRDPATFLRATTNVCRLKDPRAASARLAIVLAETTTSTAKKPTTQKLTDSASKKSEETETTISESSGSPLGKSMTKSKRPPPSLIQVINELTDALMQPKSAEPVPVSRKGKEKLTKEDTAHQSSLSTMEILTVLTEFVTAYPPCAAVLMRRHIVAGKSSSKAKRSRTKSGSKADSSSLDSSVSACNVVSFILRELIPSVAGVQSAEKRKQENVAAANLLAALAQRPDGRRRIIKELTSAMEVQVKEKSKEDSYPVAIQSLVDFLYLLLSTSASQAPTTSSRNASTVLGEVAKLMLDANTISILTKALHSVDLSHPDATQLVTAILKPLEVLTRITTVIPTKKKESKKPAQSTTSQGEQPPESAGQQSTEQHEAVAMDTDSDSRQLRDSEHAAESEHVPEGEQTAEADHAVVELIGDQIGDVEQAEGDDHVVISVEEALRGSSFAISALGEGASVAERLEQIVGQSQAQLGSGLSAIMEMTMNLINERTRSLAVEDGSDDEAEVDEDRDDMQGDDGEGEEDEEDDEDDEGEMGSDYESSDEEAEMLDFRRLLQHSYGEEASDYAVGNAALSVADLLAGGRRAGGNTQTYISPFAADASINTHPIFSSSRGESDVTGYRIAFPRELGLEDPRLAGRSGFRQRVPVGGRQYQGDGQRHVNTSDFVASMEEIVIESLRKITLQELKEKEAKQKLERQRIEKERAEKKEKEKAAAAEKEKEKDKSSSDKPSEPAATQTTAEATETPAAAEMPSLTADPAVAPATTTTTTTTTSSETQPVVAETPEAISSTQPMVTEPTTPTTEQPAAPVTPVPTQPQPAVSAVPAATPTTSGVTSDALAAALAAVSGAPVSTPSTTASTTTTASSPATSTDTTTVTVPPAVADPDQPAPASTDATPAAQPAVPAQPETSATSAIELTGIDPTFLEALPEELRAEVLASQVPQLRGSASGAVPAAAGEVGLNAEFLAALPPDIQLEVVEAERRNQRSAAAAAAAAADPSRAAPMTTADFFATLSPALREEILMTQDPSVISQLPPELLAEATNLRERAYHQYPRGGDRRVRGLVGSTWGGEMYSLGESLHGSSGGRERGEKSASTELASFIELVGRAPLEEEDVITLIRLLYLAKPLTSKNLLHCLFLNLSSHMDTRQHLLHVLMTILRACAKPILTSAGQLVHTSSQISFMEALERLPPFPSSSEFSPLLQPSHPLISSGSEHSVSHSGDLPPSLVSRRVLELLCHLARSNPRIAEYVLGVKLSTARSQGDATETDEKEKEKETEADKGKEKVDPMDTQGEALVTPCPLAQLMDLLGVPQFSNSTAQLNHLLQLLALSVKPLAVLKKREDRLKKEAEQKEERQRAEAEKKRKREQEAKERAEAEAAAAVADAAAAPATTSTASATEPSVTPSEPATTDETATASTAPAATEPAATTDQPVAAAPTTSAAAEPAATEPATTEPAATEPAATSTAASAEPMVTEPTTTKEGEPDQPAEAKKEEKAEEKPKTVEEICPVIPVEDLRYLVNILTLEHLGEATYNNATSIMGTLAAKSTNRAILLAELTQGAQNVSEKVLRNLNNLKDELVHNNDPTLILSVASSAHELNMLRIIKTLISLPPTEMHTSADHIAMLQLEPLWNALDLCLDCIVAAAEKEKETEGLPGDVVAKDKGKEKEKDKDKDSKRSPALSAVNLLLPIIEVFFVVNGTSDVLPMKRSGSVVGLADLAISNPSLRRSGSAFNLAAIAAEQTGNTTPSGGLKRSGSIFNLSGSADGSLGLPRSSSFMSLSMPSRFVVFAEKYRTILNELIRETPALLQGSFKALIKYPRCLDLDNKRHYFRTELGKMKDSTRMYGSNRLRIRRSKVMEDSFAQLRSASAQQLRARLHIQFDGEEGIDAGGVTRDWFDILAKEIFNPQYALFVGTKQANSTFQPNPLSHVDANHIDYFKFVGRIVGKALFDGHYLPCHFTASFYKHMLGIPLVISDLEAFDPEYYRHLKWMLETESDVSELEQSFVLDVEEWGMMKHIELVPGGRGIAVTNENRREYVSLVVQQKLTIAIQKQIAAFLEGFHEVIPKDLIAIFTEKDLELLISGMPEIDVESLRAATDYGSGYTEADPLIQWFWKALTSFDQEERAKFLQFVTGTSRVPLDGFMHLRGISGEQKFSIHKAYKPEGTLPTAHTCFNQLDLPAYASYEKMRESLLFAINETEGFGFG
eukprot:TRINITY_DN5737_c0_g1_i6.p1 TRINITY_DN5737_c0_g1~~TRINITY_DN5737_c0_g1_i6.p1  ORF type:complete len:3934 (-),score=815.66 TRINITY_DN5737_c0_g1_i6:63-11864(-)